MSLGRFKYTEPPRITEEGGSRATGKVRVSLRRFEYTEPPRITVKKGEAGSVRSNCHKLTQTFPEGQLPPTSQWIEDVWCSQTFPNSKLPLRPASPFITVVRGGSVRSNHTIECIRMYSHSTHILLMILLHCADDDSTPIILE